MPVRRSRSMPIVLQPETVDERGAPDRDEHQVALDRLALAEVDDAGGRRDRRPACTACRAGARSPALRTPWRAPSPRPRPPAGSSVGSISIDRHLGAEAVEDRGELAADDAAAEHDEPARHLRLGEQAGRVDAARRVEAGDRRAHRVRAGGDDRDCERDVLAALHRERVRVRVKRPCALHPLDAERLEQRGDAAGHLLDDAVLPRVARRRSRAAGRRRDDAELRERLARRVDGVRGLHPRLRRDAARRAGRCRRAPARARRTTTLPPSCAARIAAV